MSRKTQFWYCASVGKSFAAAEVREIFDRHSEGKCDCYGCDRGGRRLATYSDCLHHLMRAHAQVSALFMQHMWYISSKMMALITSKCGLIRHVQFMQRMWYISSKMMALITSNCGSIRHVQFTPPSGNGGDGSAASSAAAAASHAEYREKVRGALRPPSSARQDA